MRNNQNQKCAFEMSYYNSLHSGVQSLKILVKDVNIKVSLRIPVFIEESMWLIQSLLFNSHASLCWN